MEQRFVRKSFHVDPEKLARARGALGVASNSEAVRLAIEMVIDQKETMALASKVMKEHVETLRQLAAYDREAGTEQDE